MLKLNLSLLLVALLAWHAAANPFGLADDAGVEFIILHNNDMHARFDQANANSEPCKPADAKLNKCYGGFARVAHVVRKHRREAKEGGLPVLFLNAGDTYAGTPWFTIFKHSIVTAFLNKLKPDAMCLGNHEFDENVAGLVPFLNNAEFPVLACNLNLSKVPEIASSKSFAKSTVLKVNGIEVGVIGYVTPETKSIISSNDVDFYPEIESINAEAEKLKAMGINIIIALGHSGYEMDKEIAKSCPDVDLIIGGHTNTFLYNGTQPYVERIDGPYPTFVMQESGKAVPVVQAYAYTKYLGKLLVQFDAEGNLIKIDGVPMLLDSSVPREEDVEQLLEVYRPNITALENISVGYTKVHLDGSRPSCRFGECNLANLITDAMIFSRVLEDQGGTFWTDAPIAFIQCGGIRGSIEKRSNGIITGQDIVKVLPFLNDLYVTKISGKTIRNALERSAAVRGTDADGGFLHMSGVRVTYDFTQPEQQRVVSVKVRCGNCEVPSYAELDDTQLYGVIVDAFLLNGGDGHVFRESESSQPLRMQKTTRAAFEQFLQTHKFVYPEMDQRIQF